MGDLKDLTVEGFVDVTASDAPAPGGGSVSALAGALAAALAEMVANLTVGKAKYAEVEGEMKELAASGAALRKELVEDIQKDSTSFNLTWMLSECRKTPTKRKQPEEKQCRTV